ncbi:MAG: Calx-beta domain-containing protein [Chitinophagaceae bacterium]
MKPLILLLSISLLSAFGFAQDCASVTITGGNGQITISGLTAPIATVQVFNSSWASVYNQTYTNQPGSVVVSPLGAGQYFVNVRFYTANWGSICEKGANATATSGQPPSDCGPTFQKTFGGLQGDDEAYGIVKTVDGGYIAVGHSAASGTANDDALIMKFDNKGSLLWSKTLGGTQEDYLAHAVATADGGCVATGAINVTEASPFTGDSWLVRFDGSGNVLWQKRYFINGSPGNISAFTATSDGGYAFCGTFPNTPGVADWMVVKIDASGNILWQKKLGTGNSDSGNGIVEDNHGGSGLVVSGIIYSANWYDAVISKLDLVTGNLMWTKAYDFDSRANWPGPIEKVADGFLLSMRNADGYNFENASAGLLKIDFNGNIMWVKDFTTGGAREGRFTALPDGGAIIVYGELPHNTSSDIYLMRIGAAGNIMWTKRYPRAGAQWLWELVTDGNFVVGAGFATTGSYNDVMLVKADLNGRIGTCDSVGITGFSRNNNVTNLNFSWPVNTTLGLTVANTTYTLTANNPVENVICTDACAPAITISNVTVNENAGTASLQVCLSAPASNTILYSYATANGTATSGSDYTGGAGTVTIPAGQTCGTISIPILNDADTEPTENFTVSIGSVTGTVTINDDDQATGNCSGVTFTPGNNQITITGITAPVATVQVFNSSFATVFNQSYTNAPGTVVVPIGAGTYLVKVTFYTANWAYVCDKSENVTVVNNCPAGTICINNTCPSQTVNLNTAYSIPNLPAGTVVSWHTGTPATDANRMTDAEAQNVSVSGTYYAAIHISGGCYSATIAVNVTIVQCSSAEIGRTVQVKSAGADEAATRSIMVFPNPFTRSLRVIIDSDKKEKAMLDLMDLQGRQLKQQSVQLSPGSNTVLLEGLDQFPSGNYFLRISSASGMKTLKLMRQQ